MNRDVTRFNHPQHFHSVILDHNTSLCGHVQYIYVPKEPHQVLSFQTIVAMSYFIYISYIFMWSLPECCNKWRCNTPEKGMLNVCLLKLVRICRYDLSKHFISCILIYWKFLCCSYERFYLNLIFSSICFLFFNLL